MKTGLNFKRYWSFLIIYTLLIFLISSFPGSAFDGIPEIPFIDKLTHMFIYMGLGFISLRVFTRGGKIIFPYILFSFAYCLAVGAVDEYYQSFIPQRMTDFKDLLADLTGAFLGCVFYVKYHKLKTDL